ncbi:MAG: VCBS repeat-containing protein, partial [Planctomycetota bacterium]|nr:VCBS repeat-containing protein [Planctomycetota bacterium]
GNGLSVVWWDCDGDGRLDLYVANDLHSADKLWRNLGGGRFEDITEKALPHTAFFGMGCDFGDLDHDGRFDLCVADMSSTTHYMGKMLMGSMNVHRWFLMHADPQQYMRNAVYLNTGTGSFLEAAHLTGLASTDWTWSVRFADLDEDTRLDLFATNGIPVFTDDPDAGNEFARLWQRGQKTQALDLYRRLERVDERNIARRNLGDLKFEDVGAPWGLDESSVGQGAVVADLDRDGDLDVLVNTQNQPASLFENRTNDTHRVLVQLQGTASNSSGIGSRVKVTAGGVTQTALVMSTRGYASAGEAVEHFGLGGHATIDRLEVRWPNGRTQQFTGLDSDQHYTVREPVDPVAVDTAVPTPAPATTTFVSSAPMPAVHHEREFDDYAAQPLLPHRLSRLGPGVACADGNGDGRTDVWIGGAAGQAGTLLLAGDGSAFAVRQGPWAAHAECEDLGAVFVDFDSDGDQDLYVVSGGVEAGERTELLRDRLYRNDGAGVFTNADVGCVPDEHHSGSCVAAADFDRDGDLDLFVGSRVVPGRFPHAPGSTLLRNDGGRFVDATAELLSELRTASMVTSAVWTDLDDDGWPDLVVAAQWQPLRVFGNREGTFRDRTGELGLHDMRGQWNGVAAGDLDGDGDLDLVATNLGLNTKYKASASSPLHLFARDFDGNGTLDVVEAKHQGPLMLPVRGLSCSSEAMPFLGAKFPTYDAFARANLTEIYGTEPLQQCLELTCNELRHVVLENQGGTFVLHPLPRLAQVSAAFGIGIADFDGDGHVDLVLGHNSFSPEPETGRFDGGLGVLLRGRGGLQFDAVPAHASGIVMPEDSKGLAVIDLDGDARPDFLCATNDGPVRTFLARPSTPTLAVRLAGPAGNPTAVGARVQLVRPDGTRQVVEIAAGSGYLGQSDAEAFFTKVTPGSRIVVRWPHGHTTEHAVTTTSGRVVLRP